MTTANKLAKDALSIRTNQPTLAAHLWEVAKNQLNKKEMKS